MEESNAYILTNFRVFVFKEPPELIYTGLTKILGKPREFEKNLEETEYFDSDINVSVPIEETKEYAKS